MYCAIRYAIEPISGLLVIKAFVTWGFKYAELKMLYPDYWEYASDIKAIQKESTLKPVIIDYLKEVI